MSPSERLNRQKEQAIATILEQKRSANNAREAEVQQEELQAKKRTADAELDISIPESQKRFNLEYDMRRSGYGNERFIEKNQELFGEHQALNKQAAARVGQPTLLRYRH